MLRFNSCTNISARDLLVARSHVLVTLSGHHAPRQVSEFPARMNLKFDNFRLMGGTTVKKDLSARFAFEGAARKLNSFEMKIAGRPVPRLLQVLGPFLAAF